MPLDLNTLTVAELLQLQVDITNLIDRIKAQAIADLKQGKPNKYFQYKAGRATRFIALPKVYENVLRTAFEDQAEKLIFTKTIIPLTKAETLIKAHFDKEDATEFLRKLGEALDTKMSEPTLIYKPS